MSPRRLAVAALAAAAIPAAVGATSASAQPTGCIPVPNAQCIPIPDPPAPPPPLLGHLPPNGGSTGRLQREGSAAVSGGPRSRRVGDLGHLAQAPGLDLVDEAAHAVLVREERARLHARDRLAYVGVEVGERLRRPRRADPCVLLDLGFE